MQFDLDKAGKIPPQMKALLLFFAGTSIVSTLFAFDRRLGMIALAGLFVMGTLLVGYKRILKMLGKRKASSMSGQLAEHSASAPTGINDPAKRARLDDMTRNFDSGMEKFRQSGKDVYKLPWYLIVGEPGSGKTEAVRHCNVGFPPGLQDELQGVGGTINMNWWFTNHAVLLDTAGRLMFEEVKPGETSEWREFLQLLRRNRPNCPVNGLLLVIPAESLIRDTTEAISKKAGKIAQQLDVIQRTLDVRFPVFILVTKCDLLSGFREFFEGLSDPQSQHQMIGWTNPEERDAVFRPDQVVEHLQTVITRVRKRRLGLLRDPVPEKEGGKRSDEVDALYGLPQSLSLIGPRLRSYLETVFVAGEWSSKPLFLRGIYFTSAMREGAALDQELAEALGVSLDDLPEGRAWERERAYFLRDLFMEKAFRERGLVTRATNTKALLRRRQFLLYGAGILAFAALLGFSFFSYLSLKASVGQQSRYWTRAKQGWNDGVWHPIVERDASGHDQYKGDAPAFPDEKISLIEYHDKIRELCEKNIEVGWVFSPVARFARLEGDRKKAQRIVFEGGVIGPVVKEARRVMTDPARDTGAPPSDVTTAMVREAEALAALLRIESDTVSHSGAVETLADGMVAPLLRYVTGLERPADPANFRQLANALAWTYTRNPNGVWPPPWLSAGATTLAENKPIQAGLDRMLRYVTESLSGQKAGLGDIRKLRDLLVAFREKEAELNATATATTDTREGKYAKMPALMTELTEKKKALDDALKAIEAKNSTPGERFAVSRAYEKLVGESQTRSKDAFDIVEKSVADYVAKPSDPVNTNHPLFVQVDAKLKDKQTEIAKLIAGSFTDQERQDLKSLDDGLLADFGNGKRFYEVRWTAYETAYNQLRDADKLVGSGNLIGKSWGVLSDIQTKIGGQRQSVASLKSKLTEPFSAACTYFLDRAVEIADDRAYRAYVEQSRADFDSKFHYPLVHENSRGGGGRADGREAEHLLSEWKSDLTTDNLGRVGSPYKEKLQSFLAAIEPISRVLPTLNSKISISMVSYGGSPDKAGLNHFRKVLYRGREYDTSTEQFGGVYGYNETFEAGFMDYSVSPRRETRFAEEARQLLNRTKGGGGRVSISVDGLPIYLEVSAQGPAPDQVVLPDKDKILATLR